MKQMQRLLEIMEALRHPQTGCPWDLEQSYETIVPHTLEEAYEVAEAIERGDRAELRDELGDLLFQVVFYAQLAKEEGLFDFDRIAGTVADKIVRRHPHVFEDKQETDSESQKRTWEAIKARERAESGEGVTSALDGVASALPALTRAVKLQRRAARVGFDWDSATPVFEKVREELAELEAELVPDANQDAVEEELGDILFACANLARHLGVDPETAVRRTNRKFERRFRRLERLVTDAGGSVDSAGFDVLEAAYQNAKSEEKESR
jgi:MazG family protein